VRAVIRRTAVLIDRAVGRAAFVRRRGARAHAALARDVGAVEIRLARHAVGALEAHLPEQAGRALEERAPRRDGRQIDAGLGGLAAEVVVALRGHAVADRVRVVDDATVEAARAVLVL